MDEINTNKQVIYRPTSLPSFVTFDAFYFWIGLKLSVLRGVGAKALATDPRDTYFFCVLRLEVLTQSSLAYHEFLNFNGVYRYFFQ